MRINNKSFPGFGPVGLAVLVGISAFSSARAQAPDTDRIWSTIGSAGTLDKTDITKVFFDHSAVQLGVPLGGTLPVARSAADNAAAASNTAAVLQQTESAVIHYGVVPVDGFFTPPVAAPSTRGFQLKVRYLDVSGHVVVKLIEVDLATGGETTRLTFDSAAPGIAKSDNYHVDQVGLCDNGGFNFKSKAYYIEATLTHNSLRAGSAAGIQLLQIDNVPCRG